MTVKKNQCGRVLCQFPVEEGMQCDSCKRWFHNMCTNLSPAAYKRCCKPLANWTCNDCCSTTEFRIKEAIATLSGALKLLNCKGPPPQEKSGNRTDTDDVTNAIDKTLIILDASLSECESISAQKSTIHGPDTHVVPTIFDKPLTTSSEKAIENPSSKSPIAGTGKRRTRGQKPAAIVAKELVDQASPIQVDSKQIKLTTDSEESANVWRNVVCRKKRDKDTIRTSLSTMDRKTLAPQSKKATSSKPDLSDRSLILHKVEESSASDPKDRFEHDHKLVKPLLDKLLPTTVSGVTIHSLYRIGKKAESTENQPVRLLKVVLNSKTERDAILSNSQTLKGSGIYVRADLCLADRVKRQSATLELSECRQNGEKNLKIKGFRVVKVRSLMITKPLWVGRGSTKLS